VVAGFIVNYGDAETDPGRFWPILQGRTVIGRKDAAPGLDIEIDHATTSSRHAVIYASARPARMKIEDPGSTNGTFINDERLTFGTKRELSDGDSIRFGGYTVIVKIV
jgi:pSer/pThr/pTyr-binding forkhead associated (FHA) protein